MAIRFIKISSLLLATFFTSKSFSQTVSINHSNEAADTTAILDVSSTTKGLLIPRMTAQQKNTIANPATGLLVYQTDGDVGFYYFNGTSWFLLITLANTDKQNTLIYTTKGF
jgi:cyanate permease